MKLKGFPFEPLEIPSGEESCGGGSSGGPSPG